MRYIISLCILCISTSLASLLRRDSTGFDTTVDYARLSRRVSVDDPHDSFVISVLPQMNLQGSPVPLVLQTWGNTASCLTSARAVSEHHLPGYEGDILAPNVNILTIPETLKFQVGESFDSDMVVYKSLAIDSGWVGNIGVGWGSPFALANPIFTIAPKTDHFALTVGYDNPACEFVYTYITREEGWWILPSGRLAIGDEGTDGSSLIVQFANDATFGLDSISWLQFWDQVYETIPHNAWSYGLDGLRYSSIDCPSVAFPRIRVVLWLYEFYLEPADFVMRGSLSNFEVGCTVLLSESGTLISVGAPFFASHMVRFDSVENQIGFCPIG